MDKALIGLKVKTIREHRKISQAKLAEKVNISDNTLSNIETGKYYPRVDTLIALSNALDVSLVFLISDCTCPTKICIEEISKCLFILDDAVSKHLMEYLHLVLKLDTYVKSLKKESDITFDWFMTKD